jgi:hypothetical protein
MQTSGTSRRENADVHLLFEWNQNSDNVIATRWLAMTLRGREQQPDIH